MNIAERCGYMAIPGQDPRLHKSVIGKIRKKRDQKPLYEIHQAVSSWFGVPDEYLRLHTRLRDVVDKRAMAIWIMVKQGYIYHRIADYWGKDHSTMIHSNKKVQSFIEIGDRDTIFHLQNICRTLNIDFDNSNI